MTRVIGTRSAIAFGLLLALVVLDAILSSFLLRPLAAGLAVSLNLAIVGLVVYLICRELGARRCAEEEAHQQREWCMTTLTSIGDAVIVTDADARVKLLNPVAKTLTGWDDDALGRSIEEVYPVVNELTRLPIENIAHKVLREEQTSLMVNNTILRTRDGREVPIDDSGAPIRDPRGRVTGVVLVFRDVTPRRQTESALLKHAAALQQADRRKDEFLAMLAHELRNPLAPIHNAVQIMKMEGGSGPNFSWSLDVIADQIRLLTRLVDDLLDVSRITQGKVQLQNERIELGRIIERAVETCQPLVAERRHELSVSIGAEAIPLYADATRLTQVFCNLLNNAAKYTDDGGRITLTATVVEGEAVVRIRDTGVGIAPEMLSTVFDLFAQADKSLARTSGGLGIGLTLVRRLVELHGGHVAVSSEGLGKGSEFIVTLPLTDPSLPVVPTPKPTPRPVRQAEPVETGRRILLVDDNRDSAESLAVLLRAAGGLVELAFDGPTALEVARGSRPEVVLLDIGLPGMDGYEVARRLREDPVFTEVLLVAMTGYGQEEDRRRSQAAGFNAHLVKPLDLDSLRSLLARSLVRDSS